MNPAFAAQAAQCRALARFPLTRGLAKRRFTRLLNALPITPIVAAEVAGLAVELDLSKGWDRKIFLHGLGDARGVKAMTAIMSALECRTAWDIGANRGNHAAAMLAHCDRLFAFEPDPNQFPRLASLIGATDRATAVPVELSDAEGELPFFFHQPGQSASVERRDRAPDALAPMITGDAFARDNGIEDLDFVKIDVEGHELSVLRGMAGVIESQRPVIVFEVLTQHSSGRAPTPWSDLLPGYVLFGNYYGLSSRLWMTACHFGRFREGRSYTHALAVPRERLESLRGILPRWAIQPGARRA